MSDRTPMTVADLIAVLQKCDPSDRVYTLYDDHYTDNLLPDAMFRVSEDVIGPSPNAAEPFLKKGIYIAAGDAPDAAESMQRNLSSFWKVSGSACVKKIE